MSASEPGPTALGETSRRPVAATTGIAQQQAPQQGTQTRNQFPNNSRGRGGKGRGGRGKPLNTKNKELNESAADAVITSTQDPVMNEAARHAKLSKLRLDMLKADLEILDQEEHLDGETPTLRAHLKREIEITGMEIKLDQLKNEKILAEQGIQTLKVQVEKQSLKRTLNQKKSLNVEDLIRKIKLDNELEELTQDVSEEREILNTRLAKLKLAEEEREIAAREQCTITPNVFDVPDQQQPFFANYDELSDGSPLSGLSMFVPAAFRTHCRNYRIKGTGSYLTAMSDCLSVDPEDVKGWSDSMIICELTPDKVAQAVSRRFATTTSAAFGTGLGVMALSTGSVRRGVGMLAAGSILSGVASTACDLATMIKGAKLRAFAAEIKSNEFEEDARPLDDVKTSGVLPDDRLVRLRFFVELTLLDGSTIISFDPTTSKLFHWTKSSFYALGVLPTDDNRRFADLWISEHQFTTTVSRHSLVVSEFEKSRAVSRIHKLLEMNPSFTEYHDIRFATGEGVFTATLRFAALVVTKDPFRTPQAF